MLLGFFISPVLIVDVLFAAVMVGFVFAIRWWLNRGVAVDNSADNEHLKQAIGRLRELTSSVAQDVGEHSTRVQQISAELDSAGPDAPLDKLVLGSVAEIMLANERLQQQLATAEVKLQRQAEEIETQAAVARTDALTGLYNRRAFDDELHRRLAEWQRRKIVFSLLMIDVDHFKKFNDQHGHQAGDEVLRGVAQVLRNTMREMDLVTRYGGEEFALILPVTNLSEALSAAERARAAIAQSQFTFESTQLSVQVSVGAAQVLGTDDQAGLVKRADAALYASKSGGRNCVHYHDGEICRSAADSPEVQAASRLAAAEASPSRRTPGQQAGAAANATNHADDTRPAHGASDLTIFCTGLKRQLEQCRAANTPLSLMLIDVDDFRGICSRLGPSMGELVLDTLSDFLSMAVQEEDLVSRYGSGQFAVMLPDADLDAATKTAERLRTAIGGSTMQVKGTPLRFTISVGLSQCQPAEDTTSLIKRTDAALFASKASGRNCTHVHDGITCEPAPRLTAC